jgi:alpha-D-ribose 1-methylphosphonate 5-triphosphate synthase subunit PhnH
MVKVASTEPEAEEQKTEPAKLRMVSVHCSIDTGLVLSINRRVPLEVSRSGDGYHLAVPGRVFKLKRGINPSIPFDFWEAWLAENAEYPAVVSGHVFATEEN